MRIVFVLTSFASGGAEILVQNLASSLSADGHACHLIALCPATAVGNSAPFESYYQQTLAQRGISFEMLTLRRDRNPIRGALRLRRAVRRFQPNIVHLHAAEGLLYWSLAGIRLPAAYTHHNIVLKFPALLFLLFDRHVDRYIAVGEACRQLLLKYVRQPVSLIYNGVPRAAATPPPRQFVPEEPVMLSVGNLTAQKDYGTLLGAARLVEAKMRDQGRTALFLIAGEGPERPALEARIESEALGDFVKLLGARTDIAELMHDATLLVNSSIYEGLPMALLEAQQLSLPIVATDVGGNSEIVEHDTNGFLVPSENPEALAAGILDVLAYPARYTRMAATARKRAAAFEMKACADAHLALYLELVGGC